MPPPTLATTDLCYGITVLYFWEYTSLITNYSKIYILLVDQSLSHFWGNRELMREVVQGRGMGSITSPSVDMPFWWLSVTSFSLINTEELGRLIKISFPLSSSKNSHKEVLSQCGGEKNRFCRQSTGRSSLAFWLCQMVLGQVPGKLATCK